MKMKMLKCSTTKIVEEKNDVEIAGQNKRKKKKLKKIETKTANF